MNQLRLTDRKMQTTFYLLKRILIILEILKHNYIYISCSIVQFTLLSVIFIFYMFYLYILTQSSGK